MSFTTSLLVGIIIVLLIIIVALYFNKESRAKKEEGKQKILQAISSAGKVTNNDVEKMLGVSDATAERYLQELEKADQIKQVSETGRGVYYTK